MTSPGKLNIVLYHTSGKVNQVDITSTRPAAAKLLIGKSPEQILGLVPLLFSVCADAQSYAALQACQNALAITTSNTVLIASEMLILIENLREHLWRIILAWPGFIGIPVDKTPLAKLLNLATSFKKLLVTNDSALTLNTLIDDNQQLKLLITELEQLIDNSIFNHTMTYFTCLTNETALLDWLKHAPCLPGKLLQFIYQQHWQSIGQNPITCLPVLDTLHLSHFLQQTDLNSFCLYPQWQGLCFESTVLNRQLNQPLIVELQKYYHNGLIVRMVARLLEIAGIPEKIRQCLFSHYDQAPPDHQASQSGIGLGQVYSARGLLIHYLQLQQGQAKTYSIIAPTEWNFHPQGVAAQALMSLQAKNSQALRLQAELLINALDPCVAYHLHLEEHN